MMQEDYVSFETAKLLKEKGFTATAYYWCGGSCSDADGFKITL